MTKTLMKKGRRFTIFMVQLSTNREKQFSLFRADRWFSWLAMHCITWLPTSLLQSIVNYVTMRICRFQ